MSRRRWRERETAFASMHRAKAPAMEMGRSRFGATGALGAPAVPGFRNAGMTRLYEQRVPRVPESLHVAVKEVGGGALEEVRYAAHHITRPAARTWCRRPPHAQGGVVQRGRRDPACGGQRVDVPFQVVRHSATVALLRR